MQIPDILRKKVVRCFGPQGEQWLRELPLLFQDCVEKWRLTDIQVSPILSFNYVCFGRSPEYGDVALKIGVPLDGELQTEMTAINLYQGRNICRCYDLDESLGAMLLERIRPGHDLTTIASSSERTAIAARLISQLPLPILDSHGLPRWSGLARRTFGKLRASNNGGAQMLQLTERAEELICQLETSGRPPVLLHGDLNHWNILLDSHGHWKAIDPKGQVGVACMEAGRFILNELDIAQPQNPGQLLDQITKAFAQAFREPRHIIALSAFLDKALGTSWKFEEHEVWDRSGDVAELQFFYDYYLAKRNQ